MSKSLEIEQAALALGRALRDAPAMSHYLEARQSVEKDAEASAVEKELYATYEVLIARQQAGKQIPQQELEAFNALRSRFFTHPLVQDRENSLQPLKSFFAEVAFEIGAPLGVDYTTLAQK